ncbi:MAG TPA: zinc ribbon domain-containing protein, partial [Polyangiaceae bacterium]|nr:zinc ribbon domain-containing protein [Polyangiaceae bacterium]
VRCGACGGAMTPASTRKGGRAYRYYRCARRDREGAEACPTRALPAAALEGFVRARLRDCALAPDVLERALAAFDARLAEATEALGRERAAVAKQLARLEADEARLADDLGRCRDEGAPKPLAARLGEVRAELAACRERSADVERRAALAAAARGDAAWASEVLAEPAAFWDALTPANERRLVGALLDRVVVDLEAGAVELVFVFGALAAGALARRVAAPPAEGTREGDAGSPAVEDAA